MALIISLTVILIVNMLVVVRSTSASNAGNGELTQPQRASIETTTAFVCGTESNVVAPFQADPSLTDGTSVAHHYEDEPGLSSGKNIDNNWRCACEGGFLPPGLLKSFGGAEAVMRLGTGQCYHQKAA